jgi:hypothetical protein
MHNRRYNSRQSFKTSLNPGVDGCGSRASRYQAEPVRHEKKVVPSALEVEAKQDAYETRKPPTAWVVHETGTNGFSCNT